jgi:hypothetical protein
MSEMKSLTLNDKTYDSFVDQTAREMAAASFVVKSASGEIIAVSDTGDRKLFGLSIYGKTTQDGVPTPEAPVDLVSVGNGGSVGVVVVGKNILENTATGNTINGVEFTVNADGSITANGTANADILFAINKAVYGIVPGESYTISGCPNANGICRLYFAQHNDVGAIANTNTYDTGSGATAKILPECLYLWVGFYAASGTVFSRATIYPMLRLASVTDKTYEPYKCQVLTASTPNGLPGIPVTSGGNYTDANGQQWICDEIDFARGVYVKRINVVGFENASGGWREAQPIGSDNYRFAFDFEKNPTYLPSANRYGMCNALTYNQEPINQNNIDNSIGVYSKGGVFVRCDTYENVGEFVAWAKAVGLKVQYILATPIETPLSEEELAAYSALHTYKEHTTVSNDAGAWMDLEYVMDAKKYIDSLMAEPVARLSSVSLPASKWTGSNSLYSQVVTIDGITPYSKVDLLPSVEQLAIFHNKDVAFVTENEDGVVTVYAIGDKPVLDYTMQVSITEVVV